MIFVLILALASNAIRVEQLKGVKLTNLKREVNLENKYVQSRTKFTLINDGIKVVDKFYLTVPKDQIDTLYHAQLEDSQDTIVGRKINDLDAESRYNVSVVEFQLPQKVDEKSRRTFTLIEQYYDRFRLLPAKITLTEDQLVVYEDDIFFYSPYLVLEQQSHFRSRRLISYDPKQDAVERGSLLEYPIYRDVQPFSSMHLRLHVENNSPLTVFRTVRKTIEVSHWGNIAILEEYALHNQGANLTGEFGRVVFNKYNTNAGKNALKELIATLPFSTWGIYYRDEIGNISTSNAKRDTIKTEKLVKVELRPRFPILGGWRSNFQLGYNLPTLNYLQVAEQDQDLHVLSQTFGFSVNETVCENYELVIILPEGASSIEHNLQGLIDTQNTTLTYSYLDTTGRPTLIFTSKLVSNFDVQTFKVQYRFSGISIFREPLMILFAFLVFFLSLVAVGRLELVTFRLKRD